MNDYVHDDENLYRRIICDPLCYTIKSGVLTVTPSAFSDRDNQPSVDRASLCNHDPVWTQGDSRNGVVLLIARQVRSIDTRELKPPTQYSIDVLPAPYDGNMAHAEIHANPPIPPKAGNIFRRLRMSLSYMVNEAILANQNIWLIRPHKDCAPDILEV